ncbi:hypothetical protein GCM10010384_18730 [Streptomyces djakartensis]|uniref:Uncharacterized protein n=1 Tax=Streptomyces djakartensis TaxID=68193 RepID=A0ABQ2ZGS3_9ACTN|nr:hypothetical protein GCM10010384_18730 [Streptomyces djakartensis]
MVFVYVTPGDVGTAACAVPAAGTPVAVAAAEPAIMPRTVRRVSEDLTGHSLWCWWCGDTARAHPFGISNAVRELGQNIGSALAPVNTSVTNGSCGARSRSDVLTHPVLPT